MLPFYLTLGGGGGGCEESLLSVFFVIIFQMYQMSLIKSIFCITTLVI